ncbi:uncharacterized protein LOC143421409 [Maylandia zebra]|uniref:uncharacterized protein LOC143421409 n=1 Tax=Maylandia zebra TaxID=106582 RepID=UPI00403D1B09
MNFRAVLIFFCLLAVKANCEAVGNRAAERALNASIRMIRVKIRSALEHLDAFGLLPNITCFTLNISELIKPEQRHLTAHQLSSFECYMAKVSKFTPELSSQLHYICQIIRDVVHLWTGNTVSHTCRLPSFKQDLDSYVYTKCLLELVDEWLGKATFRIH